ncbi:16S rRNA processing protein RimM [Dysgonomonas sp. 216]|uniref:ribosome maturation factor RimM n=1 Tax=Dysgonomonas sp. 216 TaxID=2302934 RepID=UPI0013D6297A|nr:ribosome maturation factor RimM [Dysgonomonas sp. 216]NDW19318.1 16S rRNA processing protein RimM [Dysgonomonas sp. 216]
MILEDEIFKIGKFLKPHGIKGEIAFLFENDVFDKVDCPYLVCLVDGIFVPFFVEEYRFKGKETALIKFEGMDSDEAVSRLNNTDVYFPRDYFDKAEEDVEYSWNFFIGFKVTDSTIGDIGVVESIDDATINVLFVVKRGDEEILIPASEDFILNVDARNKIVEMNLPEGLIEI